MYCSNIVLQHIYIAQETSLLHIVKCSFYLALLVMITFIQVNTSSYRACKKLQYSSTFRFIGTNDKRKRERGNINNGVLRNRKKKAKQKV